jgi:hypothetical protein
MFHYHIRWSGGKLDWEVFENEATATDAAEKLVRPSESYTIQGFDGDCPQCFPQCSNQLELSKGTAA